MASQLQEEQTQASETTIETAKTVRKSQRGQSFNIDEDKVLISAWLNVNRDIVVGDKRKYKAYWKRVLQYFDNHKKIKSSRNQNSLMNRWSTIQLSVSKFCGCLDQIEESFETVSEGDKIRKARMMYKEVYKHFFPFEHCWELLKCEAKWLEKCGKKSAPTPSTTDSVNLVDDNVSHASFLDLESPSEREAEKCISNEQGATENESVKVISIGVQEDKRKMNAQKLETFEESFDPEKKRICLEEERLRLERQREDERIIMIDISGLTPMQAKYYQQRQREILERFCGLSANLILRKLRNDHFV